MDRVQVFTDASAQYHYRLKKNRKVYPSSIGAVIKHDSGKLIAFSRKVGYQDSNYAEFLAFYLTCCFLHDEGLTHVNCFTDCINLVCMINQQNISHKKYLRHLSNKILEVVDCFDEFSITWIPRRFNHAAHKLAFNGLSGRSQQIV